MSESIDEFRSRFREALDRLHARADPDRWKLAGDVLVAPAFAAAATLGASPDTAAVERLIDSLRAPDLSLAAACKAGNTEAWSELLATYRPLVMASARAIVRDDVRGRELGDSLWAELYGLEVRAGRRRSLLDYFHGRSSLATWLRAVLAQRHVDSLRASARLEPLDNHADALTAAEDPPNPDRARYLAAMNTALHAALAKLAPRDRMRLGYYYRSGLNLKQIGRLMREHESSVSRHLERTRTELRREIESALREQHSFDDEQIRLCYDCAARELPLDLARVLPETA